MVKRAVLSSSNSNAYFARSLKDGHHSVDKNTKCVFFNILQQSQTEKTLFSFK